MSARIATAGGPAPMSHTSPVPMARRWAADPPPGAARSRRRWWRPPCATAPAPHAGAAGTRSTRATWHRSGRTLAPADRRGPRRRCAAAWRLALGTVIGSLQQGRSPSLAPALDDDTPRSASNYPDCMTQAPLLSAAVQEGPAGSAAIAAGSRGTVRAGAAVLAAGGNAVDAALAAMLATPLGEPAMTSMGGGGFLLVRTPEGESTVVDFFVDTPGLGSSPRRPASFVPVLVTYPGTVQTFHIGAGAAAVPGCIPGLPRRAPGLRAAAAGGGPGPGDGDGVRRLALGVHAGPAAGPGARHLQLRRDRPGAGQPGGRRPGPGRRHRAPAPLRPAAGGHRRRDGHRTGQPGLRRSDARLHEVRRGAHHRERPRAVPRLPPRPDHPASERRRHHDQPVAVVRGADHHRRAGTDRGAWTALPGTGAPPRTT